MKITKKHIVKAAFTAVFAISALWFIYPSLLGIGSLGHIIGFFICAAVIAALYVFPLCRKSKPLRILTDILTAFFVICCVYAIVLSTLMLSAMTNSPKEENSADTVIVLGCLVKNGKPSPMLERRLLSALAYLEENPSAPCIVTGGQGANESHAEGDIMKQWLVGHGIEQDRIYVEKASEDTLQNLSLSLEIMEANGLSSNVIIVSDGFHLYRASRAARELGLSVTCISADTDLFVLPGYWVREWMGLSRDIFLG